MPSRYSDTRGRGKGRTARISNGANSYRQRRQEEAESWAHARSNNLTKDPPPTNRVAKDYLARHYASLLYELENGEHDSENPQQYTIRQAKQTKKNSNTGPGAATSEESKSDQLRPIEEDVEFNKTAVSKKCSICVGQTTVDGDHEEMLTPCCDTVVGKRCYQRIVEVLNKCMFCEEEVETIVDDRDFQEDSVHGGHKKEPSSQLQSVDASNIISATPRPEVYPRHVAVDASHLSDENKHNIPTIVRSHFDIRSVDTQGGPQVPTYNPDLLSVPRTRTTHTMLPHSIDPQQRDFADLGRQERLSILMATANQRRQRSLEGKKAPDSSSRTGSAGTPSSRQARFSSANTFTYEEWRQKTILDNPDYMRRYIDGIILSRAFLLYFGPQRLPTGRLGEGGVYHIVPPPGYGGPNRISMFYTGIFASRMLIPSEQPSSNAYRAFGGHPGVLYYDGKCPISPGNVLGSHSPAMVREPTSTSWSTTNALTDVDTRPTAASSEGKWCAEYGPWRFVGSSGLGSIRFSTSKGGSTLPKDYRSKMHTVYRSVDLSQAPKVHIGGYNQDLSEPDDLAVHVARSQFALELIRRALGVTSDQLQSFLAINVPAIDNKLASKYKNKTATTASSWKRIVDFRRSRFFKFYQSTAKPDGGFDEDTQGPNLERLVEIKNKASDTVKISQNFHIYWEAKDFIGFRVVPKILELVNPSYDLNSLAKQARICLTIPTKTPPTTASSENQDILTENHNHEASSESRLESKVDSTFSMARAPLPLKLQKFAKSYHHHHTKTRSTEHRDPRLSNQIGFATPSSDGRVMARQQSDIFRDIIQEARHDIANHGNQPQMFQPNPLAASYVPNRQLYQQTFNSQHMYSPGSQSFAQTSSEQMPGPNTIVQHPYAVITQTSSRSFPEQISNQQQRIDQRHGLSQQNEIVQQHGIGQQQHRYNQQQYGYGQPQYMHGQQAGYGGHQEFIHQPSSSNVSLTGSATALHQQVIDSNVPPQTTTSGIVYNYGPSMMHPRSGIPMMGIPSNYNPQTRSPPMWFHPALFGHQIPGYQYPQLQPYDPSPAPNSSSMLVPFSPRPEDFNFPESDRYSSSPEISQSIQPARQSHRPPHNAPRGPSRPTNRGGRGGRGSTVPR